jgi:hypothetical protein
MISMGLLATVAKVVAKKWVTGVALITLLSGQIDSLPLSEAKPSEASLVKVSAPQSESSNTLNPSGAESRLNGTVKVTAPGGDQYVIEPKSLRVLQVTETTRSREEASRVRHTLDYFISEAGENLVRIRSRIERANSKETYEMYSTENGGLTELLESGKVVSEDFLVERRYDRSKGTVTVYNATQGSLEATYELKSKESEEPFRLIQISGGAENERIDLDLRYDDLKRTQTVIDRLQGTYQVYELLDGQRAGDLLELGTVEFAPEGEVLHTQQIVERFHLQRRNERIPTYVFTQEGDPNYLLVRERLPEGGIGRILWYRGPDEAGRLMDQEYYYGETLTIVDFKTRRFLKFELDQEPETETRWDPFQEPTSLDFAELLGLSPKSKEGFTPVGKSSTGIDPVRKESLRFTEELLPENLERMILRVRGPPAEKRLSQDPLVVFSLSLALVHFYSSLFSPTLFAKAFFRFGAASKRALSLFGSGSFSQNPAFTKRRK